MATIVLAHGAWSAAWAWKKMRPLFAAAGHQFFSPTYTGLGERAHLAHHEIDLTTHINDVAAVSRGDLIVNQHIVVHNAYLQLWAETGVVGLLLFLTIVVSGLQACLLAARRFDARGDPEMATMARAALLALVGALAASFFLSNVDDQRFWVLIAFGPALLTVAWRGEHTTTS